MRAILTLVLLLAGCAADTGADATPTATAEPTEEPTASPAPTPRPTPVPTPTPLSFEEQFAAAETIAYDELFRNSADHIGKDIAFRGQVLQVLGEPGGFELRIAVTPGDYDFWEDPVYIFYEGTQRFLNDDIVDFVGMAADVVSYESAGAGEITIPAMFIDANGIRLVE